MNKKYEGNKLQLWEARKDEVLEYFKEKGGSIEDVETYLAKENDYREILVVRTTEGEKIGYVDIFFMDTQKKKAYLSDILFETLERYYGKKAIKYVIRYLKERGVLQIELNLKNMLLKKYQSSNGWETSVLEEATIAAI